MWSRNFLSKLEINIKFININHLNQNQPTCYQYSSSKMSYWSIFFQPLIPYFVHIISEFLSINIYRNVIGKIHFLVDTQFGKFVTFQFRIDNKIYGESCSSFLRDIKLMRKRIKISIQIFFFMNCLIKL